MSTYSCPVFPTVKKIKSNQTLPNLSLGTFLCLPFLILESMLLKKKGATKAWVNRCLKLHSHLDPNHKWRDAENFTWNVHTDSPVSPVDHFTVDCSVNWPLNGSKAGGDLVLIKTSLFLLCKLSYSCAY